jgi:hypothetical protein
VPKRWAKDLKLGRWVGRQRVLKRKLDRGDASQRLDEMTAARAAKLQALDFA